VAISPAAGLSWIAPQALLVASFIAINAGFDASLV
jgi:hypothetical protein